jgi:DNA-binding MarR family transcriptional regulator
MPRQHYRPETYRIRSSVGYLLRRTAGLLLTGAEHALEGHGLTFMQWVVLMYLRDGVANTAAAIRRELGHDSGAMTRIIDQLERRALVERRRSGKDRRVVELVLTAAGRRTADSLLPMMLERLNGALAPFTADEVRQLSSLLTRLLAHMERLAAQPRAEPARSRGRA